MGAGRLWRCRARTPGAGPDAAGWQAMQDKDHDVMEVAAASVLLEELRGILGAARTF